MRSADKIVQRRVATTLAHLCSPDDQRTIFIDSSGEDLLIGMLFDFKINMVVGLLIVWKCLMWIKGVFWNVVDRDGSAIGDAEYFCKPKVSA
jgi:hypothetical protein